MSSPSSSSAIISRKILEKDIETIITESVHSRNNQPWIVPNLYLTYRFHNSIIDFFNHDLASAMTDFE
jgi:hypothetical protein